MNELSPGLVTECMCGGRNCLPLSRPTNPASSGRSEGSLLHIIRCWSLISNPPPTLLSLLAFLNARFCFALIWQRDPSMPYSFIVLCHEGQ